MTEALPTSPASASRDKAGALPGDRLAARGLRSIPGAAALPGYGLAVLLAIVFSVWVLRLWEADLSVPFLYDGDALLNLLWIKTLIERGWFLYNDSLGAPGRLEMHDFPLVDSLFFALLKLVSLFARDSARTLNLYFLLTFPMVTVTALAALRRLGVSYWPGLVTALLFAFLPYHFYRGQGHLFLASYFLIPPMVVVLLRIAVGPDAVKPREGSPGALRWCVLGCVTPGTLAVCLLMGCGGVYYAFFSCYLLLVAGLAAGLQRRRVAPLAGAGVLIAVIVAAVLANLAPHLIYDTWHGPNPKAVHRSPIESEIYGLRLAQLLAPLPGHRLGVLARLRQTLGTNLPSLSQDEGVFPTLGVAASVGFVLLLGRLLVPRRAAGARLLDGLALLNVAAVLLAVTGGVGTVFNLLISPMIRCYNRMSIFIACFALFALALLWERLRARLTRPSHQLAFRAALGLVLIGGILDQTSSSFVLPYARYGQAFARDAEFVRQVESSLPPRAMVFQLPSIEFPEPMGPWGTMGIYDPVRPYLHSRRLRWSHGAMKGRQADRWRAWVAGKPLEEMVEALSCAGFAGIEVNRSGYADGGSDVEARLARVLGAGPSLVNRDGVHSFFWLADHAGRLRRRYGAAEWERRRREALAPLMIVWGSGFYPEEKAPDYVFHWSRRRSELILLNTGLVPCRVSMRMRCIAGAPQSSALRIRGPGWETRLGIDGAGRDVVRELVLPPGETRLIFACKGPSVQAPGDPRTMIFRVADLSVERLESGTPNAVVRADAGDGQTRSE
jgi:phosphoglycerol transferase